MHCETVSAPLTEPKQEPKSKYVCALWRYAEPQSIGQVNQVVAERVSIYVMSKFWHRHEDNVICFVCKFPPQQCYSLKPRWLDSCENNSHSFESCAASDDLSPEAVGTVAFSGTLHTMHIS